MAEAARHITVNSIKMTPEEFELLRRLVYELSGISLSEHKLELLRGRLQKRVWTLNMTSFREYYDRLRTGDPNGTERVHLLNCISTNKTDFWREPDHFDFMREVLLPQVKNERPVRIISAGCSSGEEVYTIAITMAEYFGTTDPNKIQVYACDINTEVLERAANGIYTETQVMPVPPDLLVKYFNRGFGRMEGRVQVKPEIRRLCQFQRANLMERLPYNTDFHAVFCRNVAIYFDRETQEGLFRRFCNMLAPKGFLFLGHSESLISYRLPLSYAAPSTYQLKGGYRGTKD